MDRDFAKILIRVADRINGDPESEVFWKWYKKICGGNGPQYDINDPNQTAVTLQQGRFEAYTTLENLTLLTPDELVEKYQ